MTKSLDRATQERWGWLSTPLRHDVMLNADEAAYRVLLQNGLALLKMFNQLTYFADV